MNKTPQSQEAEEYFEQHKMTVKGTDYLDKEDFLAYASQFAHVTDINVGDIPTPSKGQETKELKQRIEAEINDLHEEFKNLPQEDQDKRKSWMAVRCDVLRQVLFWIASPPNSEQGVHECDASKCVEN